MKRVKSRALLEGSFGGSGATGTLVGNRDGPCNDGTLEPRYGIHSVLGDNRPVRRAQCGEARENGCWRLSVLSPKPCCVSESSSAHLQAILASEEKYTRYV
jgi:hypothetical protein